MYANTQPEPRTMGFGGEQTVPGQNFQPFGSRPNFWLGQSYDGNYGSVPGSAYPQSSLGQHFLSVPAQSGLSGQSMEARLQQYLWDEPDYTIVTSPLKAGSNAGLGSVEAQGPQTLQNWPQYSDVHQ